MTYLLLALVFVTLAAVAGYVLARKGAAGRSRQSHWLTVALTFLTLSILTAVFDSLMIGLELFHYDPAHIAGIRVGLAPIEDFAYPLVCALLLPALWLFLTQRRAQPTPSDESR